MRWLLLFILVAATVVGELLQSYEMKQGTEQQASARGLMRLLQTIASRKYLIVAIACMAVSFFAFMELLQSQPLSFVVPASAATFVLETVLAKFLLKEAVGLRRATGAAFVLVGVVLLAR